jgi:hypothetical protein
MAQYRQEWHDMSNFVVHFVSPHEPKSAYDVVMSILWERTLRAFNPFGIARHIAPDPRTQYAVCLSEVPLHLLARLADRRSSYGLGFTKQIILERGGGPIWYVENESPSYRAIEVMIDAALAADDPASESIWSITPFIDAPGDYPGGSYRFEWEREWRHVGDLSFETSNVEFLIVPEELHDVAQGFFYQAWEENLGPAYFCPIIDPYWNLDRVRATFENHDYSWMRRN